MMAGGAVVKNDERTRVARSIRKEQRRRKTEKKKSRERRLRGFVWRSNGRGRDVRRLVMRSSASAGTSSRETILEQTKRIKRINGRGIRGSKKEERTKEGEGRNNSKVGWNIRRSDGHSAYWGDFEVLNV